MSKKPKFQTNMDAVPMDLKSMIQIQEGAVVSREIYVKGGGTLTIFAFDKDQGLSEHTAPFDAIVQVLEGEVEISIAGKPFLLKRDELIIMPANAPHALKAITAFKMLLMMFSAKKESLKE